MFADQKEEFIELYAVVDLVKADGSYISQQFGVCGKLNIIRFVLIISEPAILMPRVFIAKQSSPKLSTPS